MVGMRVRDHGLAHVVGADAQLSKLLGQQRSQGTDTALDDRSLALPAGQVERIGCGSQHAAFGRLDRQVFVGSTLRFSFFRHFRGKERGAESADELRVGRHEHGTMKRLPSQADQHRVVRGHAAGHHQGAGDNVHFSHAIDDRAEGRFDDVLCAQPGADLFQNLRRGKDRAETPQGDLVRGSFSQAVEIRR